MRQNSSAPARGVSAHLTPILLAVLIVLQAFTWLQVGRATLAPTEYEYRIETPSDAMFKSSMDAWGKEGWAVVSARRAMTGGEFSRTAKYEVILMREKR